METPMKSVLASLMIVFAIVFSGGSPSYGMSEPGDAVVVRSDDGGWLGVSVQDMTPRLARTMRVETKEGALVNEVIEESPASKAGILSEDVIVGFNNKAIVDAEDLIDEVGEVEPGTTVGVEVVRGNDRMTFQVEVGKRKRPRVGVIPPMPLWETHQWPFRGHTTMGMELQELGDQLRGFFGAPENEGVLVAEVDAESAAGKAGFAAGDVILKAGNQAVREIDDIWDEVEEYNEGETVTFEILRNKSRKTLNLEIEEPTGRSWFQAPHGFRFHFECDPEVQIEKERLGRELRRELDRSRPELEKLRIELKEMGKEIRELGRELGKELEKKLRSVLS
jgi:predicted metalloprotease with PDZ domain